MRILYFNPETEYALASGASFYTPPASVETMRRRMQLLPLTYSREGDAILVDSLPLIETEIRETSSRNVEPVDWHGLQTLCISHPDAVMHPWGWNHALRRRLVDSGVPESMLITSEKTDLIRNLAHRRTTIFLNREWNRLMPSHASEIPVELFSTEECIEYWRRNEGCWLKAPWSSSGRGVINTGADLEERHIRPWCAGIIRRQGSVMGETEARRVADFASEWIMRQGEAIYLGISSFDTSRRGKYLMNHDIGQDEMRKRFDSLANIKYDDVISIQKSVLEKVLTGYDGPVGIDIIIGADGSIRPFVEANLRITMGMIRLESARSLL